MQCWREILHSHSLTPAALHLILAGYLSRLQRWCFMQHLPNSSLWHPREISFFHVTQVTAVLGACFYSDQSSRALQEWPYRAVPALGAGCSPRRGISCCSTHGVPGSCLSPCPLCSLAAQPGVTRDGFANVSGVGPWRGKGLCYTLFLQKLGLNLPVCSPAQHSIPCVLCCRSCEPWGAGCLGWGSSQVVAIITQHIIPVAPQRGELESFFPM